MHRAVPVYEVVFVEVKKPRGNVTSHSLEYKRVGSLGISNSTTAEVTLQIALRG